MSNKETGGSAFPVSEVVNKNGETIQYPEPGMTLRDYFASKALDGYLSSMSGDVEPAEFASRIAADCYVLADAMLKAREAA